MGCICTGIYLFQPWRSCPYDDSPAACAMLPVDATVMMAFVALFVLGIGAVALGGGLLIRDSSVHS